MQLWSFIVKMGKRISCKDLFLYRMEGNPPDKKNKQIGANHSMQPTD